MARKKEPDNNVRPVMSEGEKAELLRLVDRIRLVHNGEYIYSALEAAVLIHQKYGIGR